MFPLSILIFFLILNLYIVYTDIVQRTISNKLLIILLILFPIWAISQKDFSIGNLILEGIMAIIITLYGIFSYSKKHLIGAGDIKYGAILLLYTNTISLSNVVANIGGITLILMILWVGYCISQILILWNKRPPIIGFLKKQFSHPIKSIAMSLFQWVIMGYLISLFIPSIFILLTGDITLPQSTEKNFYLILVITIFFIRNWINLILKSKKYQIPFLGIIIFTYIKHIMGIGNIHIFISNMMHYLTGIIYLAISFIIITSITRLVFLYYDKTLAHAEITENIHITIPYSIAIFLGYTISMFTSWNIIHFILY